MGVKDAFIIFFLLLLSCHETTQRLMKEQQQQQVSKPDYSYYHRKDELLKQVRAIVQANPKTMRAETKTSADDGYKVDMLVVTVELGGISNTNDNKQRILMDFGEHAREFVSAELGLRLMQVLANPLSLAQIFGPQRGNKIAELLQHIVFKILPLENVRGRDLVEKGALCERKNGRGVDTNRNWEVDWGRKEKDYDPNEEFPGKSPLSEPETQIVRSLAQELQPHVWVNVHSGMDAMFVPYDHKAEIPIHALQALSILKTINAEVFNNSVVVDSGGKGVGYLAHGTATDYMFEKLKVPITYTWEIFGDLKADYHDCFKMFNPVTEASLDAVLKNWLKAVFILVEQMQNHPSLMGVVKPAPPPRLPPPLSPPPITQAVVRAAAPPATQPAATTKQVNTTALPGNTQGMVVARPRPPGPVMVLNASGPVTSTNNSNNNIVIITLTALPWPHFWPHTLLAICGIGAVTVMLVRYMMMSMR